MRVLVTGGAGFIGRWVVKRVLDEGNEVRVVDDLSNGRHENIREFEGKKNFLGLVQGDVANEGLLHELFATPWDEVYHLAASIHVQKSIDDPGPTIRNDVEGTHRVLEACRRQYFKLNGLDTSGRKFDYEKDVPRLSDRRPRVAVMSTCMVYDATDGKPMAETQTYRPASPYAAAKIGADMLGQSYALSYAMPTVIVRPFNTYGPFQKSNSEGGVVSIFLQRDLDGKPLLVKGSGKQTRDLLYVEDCADFVVSALRSDAAVGQILNAGTGRDISVADLAKACCSPKNAIEQVPHDHPQAEIMRLVCDSSKAQKLLGWGPKTSLEEGLKRTRAWLAENPSLR